MSMQQQQYGTESGATGYETGGVGQQGIAGQQPPGQQQMGQQQMGQQVGGAQQFESSLTGTMRLALHDFVESLTVCDWCADQCIDEGPEMAECIRLCRDVSDLAALNVQLMSRDSIFGPEAAQLFAEAARECARECARHPQPHCQECASVLSRAVDSTWEMLDSFQQGGGTARGQQFGQPQMGQQQFGQPQAGQQGQYGQGQVGGPQQY